MSYKVEYLARNLFGEKVWDSALLRFATIAEAVWDYEQGRYSPVGEGV